MFLFMLNFKQNNLFHQIDQVSGLHETKLAFRSNEGEITYGQLRFDSDSVSRYLIKYFPTGPIIVFGHKSPQMLSGILGAAKAGCAYIPIDTSFPQGRIEDIISASGATLVLDCSHGKVPSLSIPIVSVPIKDAPDYSPGEARPFVDGAKIVYIIFTSGSSGRPKGIEVSHDNLLAFVDWSLRTFIKGRQLQFLNQAPFSFDLSVMELYSALVTGGSIYGISKNEIYSPKKLFERLYSEPIEFWVSTPSFVDFCLKEPTFCFEKMKRIKTLWFCGEVLKKSTAFALLDRFPKCEIYNTYGPTEATVAVTSVLVTPEILQKYDSIPLGRTNQNAQIHLATTERSQLKEIVITGPQVARGYHRSPELTSAAFFKSGDDHCYRTGDAGFLFDDFLFYQGRIDLQVKINGHRVEIGEIESKLIQLAGVERAIVLVVEINQMPTLVAVLETQDESEALQQNIRKQLALTLPDYMLPRFFYTVPELPLNTNGKVDRLAAAGYVRL